MFMMPKKRIQFLAFLFPIQLLMIQLLKHYPSFIANYYSNGLYPVISNFERFIFGKMPFSLGDILYILLFLYIVYFFYKTIKAKKLLSKATFYSIMAFLSVLYFVFQLFWGLNYLRTPLYKTMAFPKEKVTKAVLLDFTKQLINKTNQLQKTIMHNDTLPVSMPYDFNIVFQKTKIGYQAIQNEFGGIDIRNQAIKKSMLSLPQIYMGFTGYLNPFTGEAQVNYLIPKLNLPATACHEIAHQMGYASETEANFIGFMASIHNSDVYFQYSACFMALNYALHELQYEYPEIFEETVKQLNKGVQKNQKDIQTYYKQFQLPFALHSKAIYDFYLKANNQKEGIASYRYMVYLLIKYDEKKHWLSYDE